MRSITKYKGMCIVSLIMHSTISLLLPFATIVHQYTSTHGIVLYIQLFDLFDQISSSSLWSCVAQWEIKELKDILRLLSTIWTIAWLRTRRRRGINCTQHFRIALLKALDFSSNISCHYNCYPSPSSAALPIVYSFLLLYSSMTTNFTPFKKMFNSFLLPRRRPTEFK